MSLEAAGGRKMSRLHRAPEKVRKAFLTGDTEGHKAMSSAGGNKTALRRSEDKIYLETPGNRVPTQDEIDAAHRLEESGEDRMPPDPIN